MLLQLIPNRQVNSSVGGSVKHRAIDHEPNARHTTSNHVQAFSASWLRGVSGLNNILANHQRLARAARPIPHCSQPVILVLLLSLAAAVVLPGCAPLILGGVAIGASTVYDRRPPEVVLEDQQIELTALYAFLQDPTIQGHSRIAVTSYNRTVLLTGQAESEAVVRKAIDRVSRLPKVKRVIDELTIGPNLELTRESEDVYITSRAKLAMTKVDIPDFNATRVKVVTENGVVYLLGLVSPEEADAATEQVRYVPGVKRVVKLFEYN